MIDYLVVGQGLAGSFVAHYLLQRGASVRICDSGATASSRVASGLINPVTGKRFTFDVNFLERRELARAEYSAIPGAFSDTTIIRVLSDPEEKSLWFKKSSDHIHSGRVEQIAMDEFEFLTQERLILHADDIILRIHQAARVNTNLVLDTFKSSFEAQGLFISERLDYAQFNPSQPQLAGLHFHGVVFCEGWRIMYNPLFASLPFMFAKGQVLHIQCDDRSAGAAALPLVIMHGKYIAHERDDRYRFGSNYNWNEIDDEVTPEATRFLSESLRESLRGSWKIVGAQAGVRPIMKDMKAIVGHHELYDRLYVVNGLGSKGALLSPTMARMLVDLLCSDVPIPEMYNVQRFTS